MLVLTITGAFAATATYLANHFLKMGAVRASALLSLAVGLFFYFFPHFFAPYFIRHIPLVFMGASFIGMVSKNVVGNYLLIAFSGIIFSLIYLNSSRFFAGFGGALGTTACISVLVSVGLAFLQKKRKGRKSNSN
ncbi:hypothetical protein RM553_17660 [Zunongwangia sp. F363]|uniref:Uncharacterized protein n=1 Tax=Autumnicola tepida TaxID=3075595 RepID=A0ABU3CED6_9FLAO|nr:hypothetical protein [Zunongwangia sp. F363]MDT0644671.1 hypothetical protein [Zunongwangia sp. F363]